MKNIILLIATSFVLASCGKGFVQDPENGQQDRGSLVCTENCDDNTGDSTLDPAPDFELDGKVSGGIWDGKELLKLDLENKSLLIRVPVDFEADIVAGSFPIPNNTDITLEFVTDTDNSKHLQLRIPLDRLIGETNMLSRAGLPNGDGLPMVQGGKLAHIKTKVGKSDVHFYTGDGIASMFVPTSFNPFVSLTFPIKNKRKETLGYFATIAEKKVPKSKGGFYVSVHLPDKLKDLIDTWLPVVD